METAKSIYELLYIVESIEGWVSQYEQIALLHLPSMVDHLPGNIVEIGSYKGRSTIALALGSSLLSKSKHRIYAIDPFIDPPFHDFEANIMNHGLDKWIIPIKKHSFDAYEDCPKAISAIFIDGDHEYASIKHDVVNYVPRVLKGGLIAFHDYSGEWPGVFRTANELCEKDGFEAVMTYDNLLLVRKS